MSKRAVFIDRDGTIIEESGYLSDPEGVELLPGVADALRRLNKAGLLVIVVTNQSGIARGYYGEAELASIHDRLDALLGEEGARVDAYYHCPHHPEHGEVRDCDCRKPSTGMARRAADEHGIELARSYFVGDKVSDIELGENAGGKPMLVMTGYGPAEKKILDARGKKPVMAFDTLAEAADWILEDSTGS